jgi:hypothetical protein
MVALQQAGLRGIAALRALLRQTDTPLGGTSAFANRVDKKRNRE